MDDSGVDEFTRHHAVVTELLAKLPSVRDDADAYAFACQELTRHVARLGQLGPTS
ncbi:MAG: hypothetical protein ACRD1D_13925 [Acidimicrobiales bacterium]